jgi:hypothetical protein
MCSIKASTSRAHPDARWREAGCGVSGALYFAGELGTAGGADLRLAFA